MPNTVHINQIAERVERLLVRHQELQRTNALLSAQVDSLSQERDSLKSRLGAARARALMPCLTACPIPKANLVKTATLRVQAVSHIHRKLQDRTRPHETA